MIKNRRKVSMLKTMLRLTSEYKSERCKHTIKTIAKIMSG